MKIGNKSTLTFKKFVKCESAKVRDEYEMSVPGFEMRLILESLGLFSTHRMEKHRVMR